MCITLNDNMREEILYSLARKRIECPFLMTIIILISVSKSVEKT